MTIAALGPRSEQLTPLDAALWGLDFRHRPDARGLGRGTRLPDVGVASIAP